MTKYILKRSCNERAQKNIISMYNDEGKEWLDSLPDITAKIANAHNLSGLTAVTNMTFNYVASGYQIDNPTRRGEASGVARVILKIGMNSRALTKEASCLKAFAKHATDAVIANDNNMIIIQRAVPGSTLKDHFPDNDIAATKILCTSIKALHKASIPESHNFYHLGELSGKIITTW
jgi:streptomycin 6-kinase